VEGLALWACWGTGQIGESANPVNGCPARDRSPDKDARPRGIPVDAGELKWSELRCGVCASTN